MDKIELLIDGIIPTICATRKTGDRRAFKIGLHDDQIQPACYAPAW